MNSIKAACGPEASPDIRPPEPKEDTYGIAETAALLEQVDRCLEDAARRMARPPCSRGDGSDLVAQLGQYEDRLRLYLRGARDANSRCEENERIAAVDQARIHGDRARGRYRQAAEAIQEEGEQHRRNEREMQRRLVAVSATVRQLWAWQSRALEELLTAFHRPRFLHIGGDVPLWSKGWSHREMDELLSRPIPLNGPLWQRPLVAGGVQPRLEIEGCTKCS